MVTLRSDPIFIASSPLRRTFFPECCKLRLSKYPCGGCQKLPTIMPFNDYIFSHPNRSVHLLSKVVLEHFWLTSGNGYMKKSKTMSVGLWEGAGNLEQWKYTKGPDIRLPPLLGTARLCSNYLSHFEWFRTIQIHWYTSFFHIDQLLESSRHNDLLFTVIK